MAYTFYNNILTGIAFLQSFISKALEKFSSHRRALLLNILHIFLPLTSLRLEDTSRGRSQATAELILHLLLGSKDAWPIKLCRSHMVLFTKLDLLLQLYHIGIAELLPALGQLLVLLLNLGLQNLHLFSQPLQLLPLSVLQLSHLYWTSPVASGAILINKLTLPSSLLFQLFHSFNVVFPPHVIVQGIPAGHIDEAEVTPEALNFGAHLLVVCALLVGLHLVTRFSVHVALLTIVLFFLVLKLPVVVVVWIKLGRHIFKPGCIKKPLMFGSQLLLLAFLLHPEPVTVLHLCVIQTEDIVEPKTTSPGSYLFISEALLLRKMWRPLEMSEHGVSVMKKHVTGFAVQGLQSLLVLPGNLSSPRW